MKVTLWNITHLWKLNLPPFGKHFLIEIDSHLEHCMPLTIIIDTEQLIVFSFALMTCSLISVGDGGRKSIGLSTGEEAAGNQNESVQFVLEIEHEGNDSAQRTMISTETVAQPWSKGYAPADHFFCAYLISGIQLCETEFVPSGLLMMAPCFCCLVVE